jgi:tRNA threonylcarbamoyladenosine biosynthesis protein TsaE
VTSRSPEQTASIGARLGALLRPGDVVLLVGDLGAGKTHFAKGVGAGLGVVEEVLSPTFNLMHEYEGARGITLRHFDLYRLDDAAQLDDIDYFGLIEDDAASLVEWGDRFAEALPLDYLCLCIEIIDASSRRLSFEATGTRGEALLVDVKEALRDD